jgi:hypothetical protein
MSESAPPPEDDVERRASTPPWLPWAAGAIAVVVIAVVVSWALIAGKEGEGGTPATGGVSGTGGTPSGNGTGSFAFENPKIAIFRASKRAPSPDVSGAAAQIQGLLSGLYDEGVVAQANARTSPPAPFWNAFAPDIRRRAQTDADAFTLGAAAGSVRDLAISSSSLTIRFLVDQGGAVASAQAQASIRGAGVVAGSGPVDVVVTGTFVLQRVSGSWVIGGYPSASVSVRASGPTPGPTAAPTPSGSVSP